MSLQGSQPIRAIFFDYDGVLTTDKTGSISTCRHISQQTGLPLSEVLAAFRAHNLELTTGRRSHADVWPAICAVLGRKMSMDLLVEAFDSTPTNLEMNALARQLKRSHSVGIITDNKSDRIRRLRATQRLDEVFRPIVVSADVGCTKEDERIFRIALEQAGVEAGESIFIDNSRSNLAAAEAVGMHTIWFDDNANDVPALRRCLGERYGVVVRADA
jgi:putative hydrolase of the HAD superfamily